MNIKNIIIHWQNAYNCNKYNLRTIHGLYLIMKLWYLIKYSGKVSQSIIAISQKVKEFNCETYRVDRHKVIIIYSATDFSLIPKQRYPPQENNETIIGSVGKARE